MKQKIEIEVDVPDGMKAVWKDGKVVFENLYELPKTWVEFCQKYPIAADEYFIAPDSLIFPSGSNGKCVRNSLLDCTLLPSKRAALQHLALMQLHQLRDCYRQGWVPDWKNREEKYCIWHFSNGYDVDYSETAPYFLTFQSYEIAEEFLHNFHDLIEQAGDLI